MSFTLFQIMAYLSIVVVGATAIFLSLCVCVTISNAVLHLLYNLKQLNKLSKDIDSYCFKKREKLCLHGGGGEI